MPPNELPPKSGEHRQWLTDTFERYERPLLVYARAMLGDRLDASQDVVQDTFLQLCTQAWPDIESYAQGWLFRTCRHRCLDHLKRSEHRMRSHDNPDIELQATQDPSQNVERLVQQREEEAHLPHLVHQLSDKQREVLLLRVQQHLSYKQIAEITGMSVSHVGVILHEAICRLRVQWTAPS